MHEPGQVDSSQPIGLALSLRRRGCALRRHVFQHRIHAYSAHAQRCFLLFPSRSNPICQASIPEAGGGEAGYEGRCEGTDLIDVQTRWRRLPVSRSRRMAAASSAGRVLGPYPRGVRVSFRYHSGPADLYGNFYGLRCVGEASTP